MQEAPIPVFLGFCVKEYAVPPPWLTAVAQAVEKVCSVSECVASRPDDWVERWDFNAASCWNTEQEAWNTVAAPHHSKFRLYAYRTFPLLFDTWHTPEKLTMEELFPVRGSLGSLPPESALQDYSFLGYDIVEHTPGYIGYGCSPLSCNTMAADYPVNRYCLIDDQPLALQAATAFGQQQPEPGPFLIIEVWRKQTLLPS